MSQLVNMKPSTVKDSSPNLGGYEYDYFGNRKTKLRKEVLMDFVLSDRECKLNI